MCIDGLKGFPEAIGSLYPRTEVQLCIVHMVRNSLKYVSRKERKLVARDLRAIYTAPTAEAAEVALEAFAAKWDGRFPSISQRLEHQPVGAAARDRPGHPLQQDASLRDREALRSLEPRGAVLLVPVGAVEPSLLDYLALMIRDTVGAAARIARRPLSPDFSYDPLRRQYHSTLLLERLAVEETEGSGEDRRGEKRIGVTELDLFIPILTFVFGEAELAGRSATLSIARLRQSFYGLAEDPSLLYQRSEKELLHELGHTYGLIHCPDYGCVMHFSNSIEEVDLKGDRYCSRCAEGIRIGRSGLQPSPAIAFGRGPGVGLAGALSNRWEITS